MALDPNQEKLIAQLYVEMRPLIKRLAWDLLKDRSQAEEVVQETFRVACAYADSLLRSPNPKGWIVNTARNAIDHANRSANRQSMHLLEQREGGDPDAMQRETEACWASFRENYLPYASRKFMWDADFDCDDGENAAPPQKKLHILRNSPTWVRAMVSAAVVVAILLTGTVTAKAFGVDVWGQIISWTDSIFGSHSSENPPPILETAAMQELLDQNDISLFTAPTYLPSEYKQNALQVNDLEVIVSIVAGYTKADNTIVIQYTKLQDPSGVTWGVEKDEDALEIFSHNGIDYFIMTNNGKYLAAWAYQDMECSISGVETKGELIEIIRSIEVCK